MSRHTRLESASPRGREAAKIPEVGHQVLSPNEALRHLLPDGRRQGMLGQNSEPNRIVRGPDHLQRGYYPADNFVVGESVALGQTAGNSGADQPLLQVAPQAMGPIQHGGVPPPEHRARPGLAADPRSARRLRPHRYRTLPPARRIVESRVASICFSNRRGLQAISRFGGIEDLHRAAAVPVQTRWDG